MSTRIDVRFRLGRDYPLVCDVIEVNAAYQRGHQASDTPVGGLSDGPVYRSVIYPMTGVRCVCANCGNEFINSHTAYKPDRSQCSPCTEVLDDYWFMDDWDEFDVEAMLEADAENRDYFEPDEEE